MRTNNNRNEDVWAVIGKCIVAIALTGAYCIGLAKATMNSWAKFLEQRGIPTNNKNTSMSTTEAPIPTTELDIETIIQATIEETEPIVETTIPIIEETEPTVETTIPSASSFNAVDLEKYIKDIDKIEVNYKHQKYYPTKKDTFEIFAMASTTATKCEYQFNGDIDVIVNKLFENSKKYVSENTKYIMPFTNEFDKDETLMTQQLYFQMKLRGILANWENNTNNINEDFCSLENYSIVFSFDEEERGNQLAYTTHNTLVIFPERIQLYADAFNEEWVKVLYTTMNHQLNIIRQRACKCRIYRGQTYFQIPTKSLTDAAAESETKYYSDTTVYNRCFYEQKQSEELLLTLGLFRDGVTYDDYYNAIYNSDLESLHIFFNAYTEEEINKLYNILYAIDAANLKNDLLLTYYDKTDLLSLNDIRTFVGHSYKIDIFKIVLKNMIQYTNNHNDFTIKDNLIMYKFIEGLIVKDSYEILDVDLENSTVTTNYEDDFTENLYNLRSIYYEFLCNKYNASIEEINELENTDINSILLYIDNYCHDNHHYVPKRYYDTIENLVERFPLLSEISNTSKSLEYEIEKFETRTRTN